MSGRFHRPGRITPAYAGKSAPEKEAPYADQDHPRLCGEKRCYAQRSMALLGSPPPMRGKASESASNIFNARITPAYAGKRAFSGRIRKAA